MLRCLDKYRLFGSCFLKVFFFVLKNIENTKNFFGSHFLSFSFLGNKQSPDGENGEAVAEETEQELEIKMNNLISDRS